MEQFLGGLQILMQWQHFLIIPLGLAIGIVVGAIPGLTSDLGIILCIPLTYGMEPTMAILMLLAIYCGGTYGGSITAILINTPGTSANAATLFDGYPMTTKGQAFKALQMALFASTIGGLISAGHHLVDGRSGVLRYVLQVLVGHHIIPHSDPLR